MKSSFKMQSNYEILGRLIQMDRVIQATLDDKQLSVNDRLILEEMKETVDMAFYTSGWRFVESLFAGITSIDPIEPEPGKLEECIWMHLRNAIHQWGTAPIIDISERHLSIKYVDVEKATDKVVVRITVFNDTPGILASEGSPDAQRIYVEKEVEFERYMLIEALAYGIVSQRDDPEPVNGESLLPLCNVVYQLPRDHNESILVHLSKCIRARMADPNNEFRWEYNEATNEYICATLMKNSDPVVYSFRIVPRRE